MGFVDRGGGREAKGASLRRSKKNPGAAAARAKTEVKAINPPTKIHGQAPSFTDKLSLMDCSVNILSRKFDADRERIVDRAATEAGCAAMLVWCGEVERQDALSILCADYPRRMYTAIGVHPDNVDRTNKKAHQEWVENTEAIAKNSHCIAVLTGLDCTREQATHFSQEALMRELFNCGKRMRIPAMVHLNPDAVTASRFVEWWAEALAESHIELIPMIFHDAPALSVASPAFAKFLVECPQAYSLVSGRGLFGDTAKVYGDALAKLPRERMLLASDSPWHTPLNIPDEHLRTLHNDPANSAFVVEALAEALGLSPADLTTTFRKSSEEVFFGHYDATAAQQPAASAIPDGEGSDVSEEDASDDGPEEDATKTSTNVDPATSTKASADEDQLGELIVVPNPNPKRHFACVKCRTRSFTHSSLVTHAPDAPRISFKGKSSAARGDGSCDNTAFFLAVCDDHVRGGYGITVGEADAVLCRGCDCKMGTVAYEASCPCGARMDGNTVRIIASRVEATEDALTDQELLARAAEERVRNINEQAAEDQMESDDDDDKRKRKPKLNVKMNNRSNMSNFRNKNFAPGLLAQTDTLLAQALAPADGKGSDVKKGKGKKKKGGKRGGDSDDE